MSQKGNIWYIVTHPMSALSFFPGQLRWLSSQDYKITVLSSSGPQLEKMSSRENVSIISVEMSREISLLNDAVALWQLWRLFMQHRPEIINVGTPKAGFLSGIAGFFAGIPVRIYTLHGLRLETTHGLKRSILNLTERIACACAHRVVCVSPSLRDEVIRAGLTRAEKTIVLANGSANGIEVSRFALTPEAEMQLKELRVDLDLSVGMPVIGFVGRFTRDKGIIELLEAYQSLRTQMSTLRLLLVGDFEDGDPIPDETVTAITTLPGIIRTGFVEDTRLYFHLMTVLALPTYREGFPTVALEAAAAGVAVITTTATGARDSVHDGETGLIVPVGNTSALINGLAHILGVPGVAAKMGVAAQAWVKKDFVPENLWREYDRLFRLLIEERAKVRRWRFDNFKRFFDVFVALFGLVVTAPLWGMAALAIKLEDGGRILFFQERVGLNGTRFWAIKFRSMVADAEHKGLGLAIGKNDDRITRVGKFIRASSIDELPQLWNVLMGEMSIVGPRPTVPSQVKRYDDFQRRRLEVKPGLTGWAQVNGRNSISWNKRIELDVWYVDQRSFWLDLLIVLRTPLALIPNRDTHYGPSGVVEDFKGRDE